MPLCIITKAQIERQQTILSQRSKRLGRCGVVHETLRKLRYAKDTHGMQARNAAYADRAQLPLLTDQ
jgi:hypothetical protein